MSVDQEKRRKQWEMGVKIAGTLLIAFLVSPFVLATIKGLIGLLVALAVAHIAIQFMPYFALVIANARLKALKHEAAKNPIETLENDLESRKQALVLFKSRIRDTAGAIELFKAKMDERRKKLSPETIKTYSDELVKMRQVLQARMEKYQSIQAGLDEYSDKIDRARDEWALAQAAADMNRAVGTIDGDEFLQRITVTTAMDTVQKSLADAFADLNTSFMLEGNHKEVPITPIQLNQIPSVAGSVQTLDLGITLDGDSVKVSN